MTIHASDPFATPEEFRSPVRRMRGRLPAAVTLWTAVRPDGSPAGLTVSSMLIVDGDPGRVVGLVDDESELWEAASASGRFAVLPLGAEDQQLADRFAGLLPAPGGLFAPGANETGADRTGADKTGADERGGVGRAEWIGTDWGPVLAGRGSWLGCRLDSSHHLGWSLVVEATVEHLELGAAQGRSLIHHRGRYSSI